MIHNPINFSAQKTHSPLTYLDLNLPRPSNYQSSLLKSPPSEQHRLRRVITYNQSSSNHQTQHHMNLSFKENLEPQSKPRFKFSVRSNQLAKETPTIKFNTVSRENFYNHAPFQQNMCIQPFALIEEPQTTQELNEKDFAKIKQLGRGKFGTVWMVRHIKTNFVCAMKIIKKSVVREQKVQHQVAKQIRIHNSLNHQNIISFYGYFADQDHFYILTQYATYGHVYGKLRKQHRLQEEEVKNITKQTAQGLQIIHNRGFVHRDIKPENLLLQFDTVKICDFGWAAECFGSTMRKSQCGTPLYYSPQIVQKEPHNSQIDVWSLGLLVYQLIVGRVPFKIWSQFDLPVILKQEVTLPDYIDSSENLSDFVLKCLVKDQKIRPKLEFMRQHSFLKEKNEKQINFDIYQEVKSLF